jgi:hypothetical protein
LKGLNRWAFSKASKLSDPIDNDLAALGFIGRANLIATFVWVFLSTLKGLNRWAFSKASKLSDSIDNDFAALGFIGRAYLVAAFVWVRLGKGVDRDAESKDDDGVVEEHIEDSSSSCGRDVDMDEK